jgi:pimeloyl-ACP methyl ester carboxylesterase
MLAARHQGMGGEGSGTSMRQPVVFVHGAFCGGWAFDAFRAPFEAAGFDTHAPDLPFHGPDSDQAGLAQSGVRSYAKAVAEFCRTLAAPPVLVGHSLGGLVAQMAVTRLDTAGLVLLAPSAPWGVLPTTLEEHGSNFGLTLLGDYWRRPVQPEYTVARHASLDRLNSAEARATFGRFVPESGRAVMEVMQWWLDPTMATAAPTYRIASPVLALAGGKDRVNPASTVRRIANRFPASQSAFHEFPAMSHWLIGEPGWDEVAQLSIAWLVEQGIGPAAPKGAGKRAKAAAI